MQSGARILRGVDVVKMNDTIRAMFDGCENMDKGNILNMLISKYGVKESTAQTYYYTWKREFMNGANCVPKEAKKKISYIIKAKAAVMSPLTSEILPDKNYTIIAKDLKEPENDMTIECDDDVEMKVYADKCKEQGYEVQEAVTVQDIFNMTKDKPKIMLMPVVVSGGYFTYRMDYDGVRIESGLIDVITLDCIAEQEAALELWKKHYSMEAR